MPKMKTISGAKKRFRITGGGKVKRSKSFHSHNLFNKTAKQGRRLRKMGLVCKADEIQIKRMLLAK